MNQLCPPVSALRLLFSARVAAALFARRSRKQAAFELCQQPETRLSLTRMRVMLTAAMQRPEDDPVAMYGYQKSAMTSSVASRTDLQWLSLKRGHLSQQRRRLSLALRWPLRSPQLEAQQQRPQIHK